MKIFLEGKRKELKVGKSEIKEGLRRDVKENDSHETGQFS